MYVFVNTKLINKVYKDTFVFSANWKCLNLCMNHKVALEVRDFTNICFL